MSTCPDNLQEVLIGILSTHTACIAREINDRAFYEFDATFEDFVNIRSTRDSLVSQGIIKEVSKKSPYDKDYKFFFLTTTNSSKVSWTINCKLNHLFEYSKYTKKKIGHFCEDLVAEAAVELGFPEVEVRRRLGMREIDVWCKDRNENFYWVIESKNRRQEINTTDIRHVFQKAEKATSKWNVTTKPALVSSSIYNRVPNVPNLPIIRTGAIYAQDEEFFYEYKALLGSWYIEPVDSVPDRIVEQLDEQLK